MRGKARGSYFLCLVEEAGRDFVSCAQKGPRAHVKCLTANPHPTKTQVKPLLEGYRAVSSLTGDKRLPWESAPQLNPFLKTQVQPLLEGYRAVLAGESLLGDLWASQLMSPHSAYPPSPHS